MRIVYCLNSICYGGGTERVTIAKANALAEMEGNEVWIIVTDNKFEPALPLSSKVRLIDTQIGFYVNQSANPFVDLIKDSIKRRRYKVRVRQELEKIAPDVVISVNQSEKNLLPSIKVASKPIYIREIHSYKHYRRDYAATWVKRLIARLSEFYDFGWKIWHYDAIVVLTEIDRQMHWANRAKVRVMPNPLIEVPVSPVRTPKPVVMAVGRLMPEKNFASLLHAWKLVEKKHPDWTLNIWGEGQERGHLKQYIAELQLQHTVLKGWSQQIMKQYAEGAMLAVTSRYEGFGLMIIEAMASGLPVVAYDCPCGPRELITDGQDGFLISPGNEEALAERLCWLIEHEEKRRQMGKRALEKSAHYEIQGVMTRWMLLFDELVKKKREDDT